MSHPNATFASILALVGALALPLAVDAEPPYGGSVPAGRNQEWQVSAMIVCRPGASNALCNRLTGQVTTVIANVIIQQDNPTPGITFTANYTAIGPPLAPGAGLRFYGRRCAFGLLADHLRFIKGPFDGTTTCRSTVRGRMILRPGVSRRRARTPDFFVTSESATVPGAQNRTIADPLGAKTYPADTRIPVRWRGGVTARDTNQTLDVLGIPDSPMRAVPLPSGVRASLTVTNLPLVGGGSVEMVNESDGWAPAQTHTDSGVSASGTALLHTTDGGRHWTKQALP